eukprot:CAMPEP_0204871636 /NCGR_PEP_ID=MMETSP1348-20121228/36035_1 /ASSEMBLY_ACC=CAM_ASM_000700 /TAXON_ID=215587 /ORGANISM="Aplanochytrium stocchinoi, Strain GSBS06" /LENGTH=482 /DNA_ID=CAMNT_0052026059 /DNA_START=136 /DNA_END=1581 /DNA_ORIENTATION=-
MTTKIAVARRVAAVLLLLALGRKLEKRLLMRPLLSTSIIGLFFYYLGAPRPKKPLGSNAIIAPGRLPWLGHIVRYESIRDHPVEGILEWSRETNFQTLINTLPFGVTEIIVHDERDREYILKSNFKNFNKNYDFQFGFDRVFSDLLGQGIFNVDGEKWVVHRKIASNLFTGKNINVIMSKTFIEHGRLFEKALSKFAKEKKSFDIQLLFQALVFDAFCKIAFGASPQSFNYAVKGEKEPFQASFDAAQQIASDRAFDLPVIRDFKIQFSIGAEAEMVKHLAVVNAYIGNIIDSRKKEIDSVESQAETQKDILGLYIYHAKRLGRSDLLKASYLRDVIMNFMIAGRDTTSYVLTNIISLVSENRDFEEKLLQEIFNKMKGGVDSFVKNEIKTFALADATFFESLRMYPSVSNDFRISSKDDVLPSGLKLESGTVVTLPNHSIGRNPKYWDNPDKFNPERWLCEDGNNGTVCRRLDEYRFPFFW